MMIAQDPNSFPTSSNALKRNHEEVDGVGMVGNNNDGSNHHHSSTSNAGNAKRLHRDDVSTTVRSTMDDARSASNAKNESHRLKTTKNNENSVDNKLQLENENQNHLNRNDSNNSNETALDEEEEEPDWAKIAEHEPAKSDVPLFLDARDRREAAEARFASALDEAHASLKQCSDALLKTAADLYNVQRENLDSMEVQIRHDFVDNELARSQMQTKLEESASAAQAQFAQLMMRVTQLGKSLTSKFK